LLGGKTKPPIVMKHWNLKEDWEPNLKFGHQAKTFKSLD